jgi:rubrerythrin
MADEYIRKQDASDWLKQYGQDVLHGKYKFSLMYIWKNLMDLPSADVAPVRHGKWTHKPDVYGVVYCSECNYELHANSTSFCPNCGAKMDGEE